jgi:uncharacterized integral membrane protein
MYERREPERAGDGDPDERTGISPTLIALGVVAIVAVIFVVQNSNRTDVNFLFFDVNSRVWVALLVAVGLGVVLDRLFIRWWRKRKTNSSD